MGDDPRVLVRLYSVLSATGARVTHLELFPMPNVQDPADLLLSQDVIFVGGGSVANMVAVWRVHELDRILRAAYQAGVVLSGVSAGAICWFESGTTDSFGIRLRPFTAGLGLLAGSYCPHYSSEPARRPTFQSLVADGTLPPAWHATTGPGRISSTNHSPRWWPTGRRRAATGWSQMAPAARPRHRCQHAC